MMRDYVKTVSYDIAVAGCGVADDTILNFDTIVTGAEAPWDTDPLS